MSFTVKAYLEKDGQVKEIRRFSIDETVSTNYSYLVQKLAHIFPSLQGASFSTFWKDPEGDKVSFSSDDELIEALTYKEEIFKVFLEVEKTASSPLGSDVGTEVEPACHRGVVCNGCTGPVIGMRFKCSICPDYDLCSACERKSMHTQHEMLRIAKPRHGRCPFNRRPHFQSNGPCGPCPVGSPYSSRSPSAPCMQWWARQQAAAAAAAKEGGSSAEAGNDFLRHVGEQVTALLEPLGLDARIEEDASSTATAPAEPQRKDQPPSAEKSSSSAEEPIKEGSESQHEAHSAPRGASWAGMVPGSTYPFWPTQLPTYMSSPQQQQQAAELEAKVAQAVEAMRTMGFHDNDGWLTRLLRQNGGNVQRAVDEVLKRSTYA